MSRGSTIAALLVLAALGALIHFNTGSRRQDRTYSVDYTSPLRSVSRVAVLDSAETARRISYNRLRLVRQSTVHFDVDTPFYSAYYDSFKTGDFLVVRATGMLKRSKSSTLERGIWWLRPDGSMTMQHMPDDWRGEWREGPPPQITNNKALLKGAPHLSLVGVFGPRPVPVGEDNRPLRKLHTEPFAIGSFAGFQVPSSITGTYFYFALNALWDRRFWQGSDRPFGTWELTIEVYRSPSRSKSHAP